MAKTSVAKSPTTTQGPEEVTMPLSGLTITLPGREPCRIPGAKLAGLISWGARVCPNVDMFTDLEGTATALKGLAAIARALHSCDLDPDRLASALYMLAEGIDGEAEKLRAAGSDATKIMLSLARPQGAAA